MRFKELGRIAACAAAAISFLLVGANGTARADRHDDDDCGHGHVITVKADGGGDWTTIQAAIDHAAAGDTIHVYPGSYLEIAKDRAVVTMVGGVYQFGLFVGYEKEGLSIRGVDSKGRVIQDWKKVKAFVTTDSTSNFGPSGIFVEGDGITISGLDIGANLSGQNKTIEVIGDDFALLDCDVSDVYGSLYVNDFRFDDLTDTSHVQSYRIEGNNFQNGVSIDLASGAGYSGPVKHRVIRDNRFANEDYWPSISFNGADTGVPWFVQSVGGAVIEDNSFVNTFAGSYPGDADPIYLRTEGHIRARGTYDNGQFDWKSYWNDNKFKHGYVTGPNPPKEVRAYSYEGSYGTIENVRRIGAVLAGEQDIAEVGDKILKH